MAYPSPSTALHFGREKICCWVWREYSEWCGPRNNVSEFELSLESNWVEIPGKTQAQKTFCVCFEYANLSIQEEKFHSGSDDVPASRGRAANILFEWPVSFSVKWEEVTAEHQVTAQYWTSIALIDSCRTKS